MTFRQPFLAFADRDEDWKTWLAALPRLVRDVVDEWELTSIGDIEAAHGRAGPTATCVESGNVRDAVRRRFHTVVDTAGLDEDRTREGASARCTTPFGRSRTRVQAGGG